MGAQRAALNWKRGLLRLWILATAIWAVAVGLVIRIDEPITSLVEARSSLAREQAAQKALRDKPAPDTTDDFWKGAFVEAEAERVQDASQALVSAMIEFGLLAVFPPIVLLAVGIGLAWALRGLLGTPS